MGQRDLLSLQTIASTDLIKGIKKLKPNFLSGSDKILGVFIIDFVTY